MKIFGLNEAKYYCESYTPESGHAEGSMKQFPSMNHILSHRKVIKEGTPIFAEYRSCSLRDVERCLLLSASNYRRCLDLMIPSSASWAFVTAYYGSFYAAKALLGMFGCTTLDTFVIDVHKNAPGQQELIVRKIGNGLDEEPTTYRGSHRQFWDIFYQTVIPLRPIVPSHLAHVLSPISSTPTWQIDNRNLVNYDTFEAIKLARDFHGSFSDTAFPASLPTILATQYGTFDFLIELSFFYAKQFNLKTDALSGLAIQRALKTKVRRLVYLPKSPKLVSSTKKNLLLS